jgi:CRISPR-associated protein Csm4
MYEPGAVFLMSESLEDRPLLEGIHSDTRIRHCGVPITVPFKLLEDMSDALNANETR